MTTKPPFGALQNISGVTGIEALTNAEYDALTSVSNTVLYLIKDAAQGSPSILYGSTALSTNGASTTTPPPTTTPSALRVVTVHNSLPDNAMSQAGYDTYVSRYRHTIAQDCSDIVLSFSNFFMSNTETNVGNDYTIQKVSIEDSSGVVVPVLFDGLRNKIIPDGATNIHSDAVDPVDFAEANFTKGDHYWIKVEATVVAGANMPDCSAYTGFAGTQTAFIDSATTTLSDTDTAGAYTFTGGSPANRSKGFSPIILGTPLIDQPSFIAVGDSIGDSASDNGTNEPYGRAFINRSMVETAASGAGNILPCMNMSKFAIQTIGFTGSNTKWREYIAYARYAIDELGTNDVGGRDFATMQGRYNDLWGILAAGGIEKIFKPSLMARTTSTDSWTTLANQSYVDGTTWAPGGVVSQLNSDFASKNGTTVLGMEFTYIDIETVTIDLATRKWLVDGTANYATGDGVHTSPLFHENKAVVLRPVLRGGTPPAVTAVNTQAPVISGTVGDGNVLTADGYGTWTNNPTLAGYWAKAGVEKTGENALTYTCTVADEDGDDITWVVTPSNPSGNPVSSNALSYSAPSSIAFDLDLDPEVGVTASGGLVSEWQDQSGNNYHATPTSGREPTTGVDTVNGHNVITFSTGKILQHANATDTPQPLTLFLCGSLDTIGGFRVMYASGGASDFQRLWHITDYLTMHAGNWDSSAPKQAAGEFDIWVVQLDGADTKIWKNGGAATTINAGTGQGTLGYTLMSKDIDIGDFAAGKLGKIKRAQGILPIADINTIGNELATYYDKTWATATL